jgi:hypothetical protein
MKNGLQFTLNKTSMKMTDKQRALLSELMIKNLEFSLEQDQMKKWRMSIELRKLRTRLKKSIGSEAYEKFITQGKRAYGIQGA